MEGRLSLAKEDLCPEASIKKLHPCLGIVSFRQSVYTVAIKHGIVTSPITIRHYYRTRFRKNNKHCTVTVRVCYNDTKCCHGGRERSQMWAATFTCWVDMCLTSTAAVKAFHSNALFPCCVGHRDFKEEVRHYRSRSALTPPPWDPKCCKVRSVLHLGLVQHSESTDPPSVLQGIQQR